MSDSSEQKEANRSSPTRLLAWLRTHWTRDAGEVFQENAAGRGWFGERWVEFLLFVREVIRRFFEIEGTRRATALAFTTLMTLVPLVVFLSMTLRSYFSEVFPGAQSQIIDVIREILPYRADDVAKGIAQAVENAEATSAFSALVFVVIGFHLFAAVESTLNRIWRVDRPRRIRRRLLAFSMLLFWGPVLIGLSVTTSVAIQRTSTMRFLLDRTGIPATFPVIVMLAAFTMVFWLVPATHVNLRSAFVGAAFTTILFELIRFGFGTYALGLFTGRMNVIYGAFGLIIIFLVVLEGIWVVVLLGAQMSFVHQHLRGIFRASSQHLRERPEYDVYFALRGMLEITRRFASRLPAPSVEHLAENIGATEQQMQRLITELERAGLVSAVEGDDEGWLPAFDPDELKLLEILRAVEGESHHVPAQGDGSAEGVVVREIVNALQESVPKSFAEMSLGELQRQAGGAKSEESQD